MNRFSLKTPLGSLLITADQDHLLSLDFSDLFFNEETPLIKSVVRELHDYFIGKRKKFTVPLSLKGTPFQQSVWRQLLEIPYGETITYKELAASIGKPTAFRAVANANGANPFPILIPCHRVIYSDGGLGGYSCGVEKKKWLLAHENLS
jgi:O-6-methylguanine DNA methyltransferase